MPTRSNVPAESTLLSIHGNYSLAGIATRRTQKTTSVTSLSTLTTTASSSWDSQTPSNSPQNVVSATSLPFVFGASAAPITSIISNSSFTLESTASSDTSSVLVTTMVDVVKATILLAASSTSTTTAFSPLSLQSEGVTSISIYTTSSISQSEAPLEPTSISAEGVLGTGISPIVPSSTSQSEASLEPTSISISAEGVLGTGISPIVPSSQISTTITTATPSMQAQESSAAAGAHSDSNSTAAPVVGGVIGGMAVIGFLGFLLWFLRRRRKRDSLLTPLTTEKESGFYEDDSGFLHSHEKWRALFAHWSMKLRRGALATIGKAGPLKTKIQRNPNDIASVDLNRGNSQFRENPIRRTTSPSLTLPNYRYSPQPTSSIPPNPHTNASITMVPNTPNIARKPIPLSSAPNPFADPIDPPSPTSRYSTTSSSIASTTRESYYYNAESPRLSAIATARNGTRRSDPFDLERLRLWQP